MFFTAGGSIASDSNDGIESRFGNAAPAKEQGICGPDRTLNVVQPRIRIGHAPESDAGDLIAMLDKNTEKLLVAPGQRLLQGVGQGSAARRGLQVHVKL